MRLSTLVCLVIPLVAARPVRRTMNFNMFVLHPRPDAPDRVLLSTDGVSRFGPLLEYLVQRFQGLLSVREKPDHGPVQVFPDTQVLPVPDNAENEVDGVALSEAKIPGLVVKPSRTKPGTFEVEIAVVVDDEQPSDDKKNPKPQTLKPPNPKPQNSKTQNPKN